MAAGVVTGDIWQRVNQSTITGGAQPTSPARGTVGGQTPCIPSSHSLLTSCLRRRLFSDLGGCWASKQREIWAYDRVVFIQTLRHLFSFCNIARAAPPCTTSTPAAPKVICGWRTSPGFIMSQGLEPVQAVSLKSLRQQSSSHIMLNLTQNQMWCEMCSPQWIAHHSLKAPFIDTHSHMLLMLCCLNSPQVLCFQQIESHVCEHVRSHRTVVRRLSVGDRRFPGGALSGFYCL